MKYKYNGQWLDLSIKALDSMEIGSIIQFMGNTIPNGWLECNGASITQAEYPELYALIGGTLPDFRGRVLVGQDTSQTEFDTLGETGGSKYLQEHRHQMYFNYTYNYDEIRGGGGAGLANWRSNTPTGTTDLYTQNSGSGNAGNLQPYAVVKHIIKALNTTPTMASIVNGYSTSTQDGYSCDYINNLGTVLYEDASGTQNNVTLSDSINNYSYIEIYSRWYTGLSVPAVKLAVGYIQNNQFVISFNTTDGNHPIIYAKLYSISGTSITKVDWHYYIINTTEYANWDALYITKVVGYK